MGAGYASGPSRVLPEGKRIRGHKARKFCLCKDLQRGPMLFANQGSLTSTSCVKIRGHEYDE
jgi:hypothetical protein